MGYLFGVDDGVLFATSLQLMTIFASVHIFKQSAVDQDLTAY